MRLKGVDRMRKPISLLAFAFLTFSDALAAEADTPASVFAQGNTRYQAGDYSGAESCYRRLVDAGVNSGAVYYNLGNACFKRKKLGPAIYYWEKALSRLPRDRDIEANLAFANLLTVDRVEAPAEPVPVRWLYSVVHFFTPEQESWLILVLFLITNILFALFLLARKRRAASQALLAGCISCFLCLCIAGSLAWKAYQSVSVKRGVVVTEKVDIRSGPGSQNITVFTIHEGVKLQVHSQVNGWYQVSLPNGWSGWLPSDSVWIL